MSTPEGIVKNKIKEALGKAGVMYYMPSAAIYGNAGASDFICCAAGRFLAIEAKATARSIPTKLQKIFMARVEQHGGIAWVIHAGNVVELPILLRDLITEENQVKGQA
jgi:penicillin-binding protein-related factor A (putative recombinase)